MMEIILLIPICAPRHLVAILAIQENGPATCRSPLDAVIEIGDDPPHRDVDMITIAQITKDGKIAREDESTSRQSILLSDPVLVYASLWLSNNLLDWAQTLDFMNSNGPPGDPDHDLKTSQNTAFSIVCKRCIN
jgi:hypothetical protein